MLVLVPASERRSRRGAARSVSRADIRAARGSRRRERETERKSAQTCECAECPDIECWMKTLAWYISDKVSTEGARERERERERESREVLEQSWLAPSDIPRRSCGNLTTDG